MRGSVRLDIFSALITRCCVSVCARDYRRDSINLYAFVPIAFTASTIVYTRNLASTIVYTGLQATRHQLLGSLPTKNSVRLMARIRITCPLATTSRALT